MARNITYDARLVALLWPVYLCLSAYVPTDTRTLYQSLQMLAQYPLSYVVQLVTNLIRRLTYLLFVSGLSFR